MKKYIDKFYTWLDEIGLIIVFMVLALIFLRLEIGVELGAIFITIVTFLFATLAGFFVSRQGVRFASIRKRIAEFDGAMSFVYRAASHFGVEIQGTVGKVISKHYKNELKSHDWAYSFTHKTSTLTDLHGIFDGVKVHSASVQGGASVNIIRALYDSQKARKDLVALFEERVPLFQWVIIYILALILIVAITSISSSALGLVALLKAAFATSVIAVVIMLHQLDKLNFFERTIGEHSAQDILDIINGAK